MPAPDRMLATLRRAIDYFRHTPGVRGRFVELADCADVLVVGDLHGQVGHLQTVLQRADLAKHPRRHLVLQELVHGPYRYPQGGEKSHQMVDLCAALKCQYPGRVHYLVGNHELAQQTERMIAKGDTDFNVLFREGVDAAYGSAGAEVYATYKELFEAIPAALRTPNGVYLSHSLPPATRLGAFDPAHLERATEPADTVPGGSLHSLVWGRDTSDVNAAAFLARVGADFLITGHISCDDGYQVPNTRQVIVDGARQPWAYCLFPADKPVTLADLTAGVEVL